MPRGPGIYKPRGRSFKPGNTGPRDCLMSFESMQAMSHNGYIQGRNQAIQGKLSKAAAVQGRNNVESGHIQALGKKQTSDHDHQVAAARVGGRVSAPLVNHNRWHRDRGISKPNCKLCHSA